MADAYMIMLHASGTDGDTQWFDFRPTFFGDIVRIEWEVGTMSVVLPDETAAGLIRNGYARLMTDAELEEYTKPIDLPAFNTAKGELP